MTHRAFPVIYARDVAALASFYRSLGFEQHVALPPEGEPGYVGLRRGTYEMAITTAESPQQLIGIEVGSEPRFEMFVYVDDVDVAVAWTTAAGGRVLAEPRDMFWGERVGYVADPEGNPVALAATARLT